ncbi:LysR substrate-binding domain-containing protein [Citricoccus sp. NPDC079358]|uniref:DNA-binding transcriptional LysR family regulator n=1 Tax=Citricoccus muralis TaxID=169134 RepID=A0A3D9LGE2_9MICC|nr:LysR substrate-binding domain-containing protein [Citricoccus muralis]REE04734.1 DNA-binding transcriptional LysR family regulator [Citricoccus muralis]
MALPFTLRQLEIFDAVVRTGSLSAAARDLHTAQSSVSSAIDELEKQVGQRLLVRRKAQGAWPTAAGRQLHREAGIVLHTAQEAGRILQERDGQLRGPLTIGVYQTLAPYVLPLLLGDFAAEHPLVELSFVEVQHAELMAGLTSGAIDVGFTYLHEVPAEVDHQPILERPPYVLMPADHPLADRPSVTLADLTAEKIILLGDAPSKANTLRDLATTEDDERIAWVTSSLPLTRALVGKGLGVAILVQPDASPWTVDGHPVVEVPLHVQDGNVFVHIAWLKPQARRRPPRRITEMVTFAETNFSSHIARIDEERRLRKASDIA